jgi:hypothetical protein
VGAIPTWKLLLEPVAIGAAIEFAVERAAEQRKVRRLEDARRTVARLFAFAKLMEKRDPNEAFYHLLLCVAFEQESKNAWKVHDYTAIEGAQWRLDERESFHTEIVTRGKALYEKGRTGVSAKGRERPSARRRNTGGREPFNDQLCFHCQQSAEKYLKAVLEELGQSVPRTHDLNDLLNLLGPVHPTLRSLRRGLVFLTEFSLISLKPSTWTTTV